jgi:2-polyprenyl-6-methoxyphenol hydroxylase-like FAD-dependent oxidoreductase
LRKLTNFPAVASSSPMDVLWFRIPRRADERIEGAMGRVVDGKIFIILPRADHWQLGYVINKGGYQQLRKQGMEAFHTILAHVLPEVADRVELLKEWKQFSVLSVESDRLQRWYKPGLLLIGDAAHVMSPVAGVGINYAMQDAAEAANLLASKLKYGVVHERDLARVQQKRELPVRIMQRVQAMIQDRILAPSLQQGKQIHVPAWLPLLLRLPFFRTLPARIFGYGLWPVKVKQ